MPTYFDANALVKLVLTERDNAAARELWVRAGTRHASPLSFVETCAAVSAAHRNSQVDEVRTTAALAEVDVLRSMLRTIRLTDDIATHAAVLARRHALRGADAVHLASALALRDPSLVVATWDRRLHAAASASGLRVAPARLAA